MSIERHILMGVDIEIGIGQVYEQYEGRDEMVIAGVGKQPIRIWNKDVPERIKSMHLNGKTVIYGIDHTKNSWDEKIVFLYGPIDERNLYIHGELSTPLPER